MKDSLLYKKKVKRFIKKKPKVSEPAAKGLSLREKLANLKNKNQESWFKKVNLQRIKSQKTPAPQQMTKQVSYTPLKRFEFDLQLLLIPGILLVILAIIMSYNKKLSAQITAVHPTTLDQGSNIHPYPLVATSETPIISAKTAIILDLDSQVPIFSKNPDLRFSMASTTKIMTALVALDQYKPATVLTVQSAGITGTILGLLPGERLTFLNLLYAMFLPSANDAAVAIADNYPGGRAAFVTAMNEKASQLHLTNTHFSDPNGLDDDGDYTTVIDMSRLASMAIKNPLLTQITSTREKTITDTSFVHTYVLKNSNQLLGIDGVTGLKTGTTEGAGEVLVTSAVVNNHTYILVVMDSTDRFTDTRALLNFLKLHVKYVAPSSP